jgi:hypothetical protein
MSEESDMVTAVVELKISFLEIVNPLEWEILMLSKARW